MEIDLSELSGSERYRLMVASVVPRPIAFVSTIDGRGVTNLAPFSYFSLVTSSPVLISVSIGQRLWQGARQKKDTLQNIEATGEFVINMATEGLLQQVNQSSADYPPGASEIEALGLTEVASKQVRPPRVAESPVHLECKLHRVIALGDEPQVGLVIGEVIQYHAEAHVLDAEGKCPDPGLLQPLARLGGSEYAGLGQLYSLPRPGPPRD